jgi:hypothetical protein
MSFGGPPAPSPLGAEVDDPVCRLDDFEIVFVDDDLVASRDRRVQRFRQLLDIVEMQPRRRLAQDVERTAGGALGRLRSSRQRS